ncbi:MAG: excinuclease ABC subunit UvrC [Candidatus Omnitrophota bacterium]|nr:MAG: excinuclease ABC subunit UvrC [Candidatus Omnitrophota bacterium]
MFVRDNLLNKIKSLPDAPGVYFMKGSRSEVIYIGKAISLKKRVGSYFVSHISDDPRRTALVSKIRDIDFITTSSEAEALILEAGLIKQYQPKYNVAIKDDKAYPLLKLTINEKFPRLFIVRKQKDDSALYFGPYTSVRLLRQALGFMRKIFPLRICRLMPKRVCLHYHLSQCVGPCAGKVSAPQYHKIVENLRLFLSGQKKSLLQKLFLQMQESASSLDFETAAKIKEQITALNSVSIEQKIKNTPVNALNQLLKLERGQLVIEGFDISNIGGQYAVGSMVRFKNSQPEKKAYRRFKIKTVKQSNDYAMMQEVITRRYTKTLCTTLTMPDLILIDGGKGHLHSVSRCLNKLHINIPALSIAKKFEHIYVQNYAQPICLPHTSKVLQILMRVRDEAHRFAVSYHRILRDKSIFIAIICGFLFMK